MKVYIGDFKMLKEVFNHPDVQGSANPQIHEVDKLFEPISFQNMSHFKILPMTQCCRFSQSSEECLAPVSFLG